MHSITTPMSSYPPSIAETDQPTRTKRYLRTLGIYGYDDVEPVILAALISGDPLLLVGRAGTGKTYLLNRLSEALGLEHRHYNASMIAFDDLVGFPMPDREGSAVRYLPTPSTIWAAQSVLVDEINRCRPEHQNRLFALVHERRVQGILLPELRYRWAAMNPAGLDGPEQYVGAEPLDPALADRFAFIVQVKDWPELEEEDRIAIADPGDLGRLPDDGGGLRARVEEGQRRFAELLREPPEALMRYFIQAATELGETGTRISPRRVRQWVRNGLALQAAGMEPGEDLYWTALRWGLPQRAGVEAPEEIVLRSVHRAAMAAGERDTPAHWRFTCARAEPARQARMLLNAPDPDTGTLAVNDVLRKLDEHGRMAFAFALYPALLAQERPAVGAEGLEDLGRLATPCMHVSGHYSAGISVGSGPKTPPPILDAAEALPGISPERRSRLIHLLKAMLLANKGCPDASSLPALERTLNGYWEGARSASDHQRIHLN